jgi:hypothetical protein
MQNVARVWVVRVVSELAAKYHVHVDTGYQVEVRDSEFHDATDHGGGGHGYGVELGTHTTDALVENNIFRRLRHSMMVHLGASGNVFGYNYSREPMGVTIPADISVHGHYPFANLFEGNVVQGVAVTDFWGPAGPHNLFFRNRIEQAGLRLADASHHQNVVGNELASGAITRDRTVDPATLLIHGNRVDGTVGWDPDIADQELPDSYYLETKPDFFGAMEWPSTGSDRPGGTNPAKSRYLGAAAAAAPGTPGTPTIRGGGEQTVISWTDPNTGGTPTAYTLIARRTCGGPIVATMPVGNVVSTAVTATDGAICVTVRASNAAGFGPESASVMFRAPVAPSSGPPVR